MSENVTGRKVFLLNPPSVVQDGLIGIVLAAEYEVYLVHDPERVLEANEARGRRKYVRVQPPPDARVEFNVQLAAGAESGTILDISSVGMAIRFSRPVKLESKSLLSDIQL